MDDSYRFSSSGIYRSPEEGSLESVRQYVEDLPLTEGPEVFGMHSNADINFQLQETNKLFDTILGIQPRLQVGYLRLFTRSVVQWYLVLEQRDEA